MGPGKANQSIENSSDAPDATKSESIELNDCPPPTIQCIIPMKNEQAILTNQPNKKDVSVKVELVSTNKIKHTMEEKLGSLMLEEELLGSVTTTSSPAVRTSARVIQKMKMDSIRPITPPLPEKKESTKDSHQKTPNQTRPNKVAWTNDERDLFFEAINEYGKEFEPIAHYINAKLKRKCVSDPNYRSKDQVRQLFLQMYHKASKYLRFSDEVKKTAQELYAVINYGEMRKKLMFVNQKACMKLRDLVYKGSVTIRFKGKNIRIKTPSCKALQKLNQLEEWQEDIKLPSKVDVYLKPSNMDAWGRVHSLAQNPRVRIVLPLQRRLITILKSFQMKWKSRNARLCDQSMTMVQSIGRTSTSQCTTFTEQVMRLKPAHDITIHRPLINLTEFLSSYSICLNSYEDRIGVTVRGEKLCSERIATMKEMIKSSHLHKRQRSDSGSDKKSPDLKRVRSDDETCNSELSNKIIVDSQITNGIVNISSSYGSSDKLSQLEGITKLENNNWDKEPKSEISDLHDSKPIVVEITTDIMEPNKELNSPLLLSPTEPNLPKHQSTNKRKDNQKTTQSSTSRPKRKESFRPLIKEEAIKQIKQGWTVANVGDLTIGDLYLMFGQNYRVNLDYCWEDIKPVQIEEINASVPSTSQISPTYPQFKCKLETDIDNSKLGNRLKHLLLMVNLSDKTRRKQTCSCGHYCSKAKDDVYPRSFVSNKIYPSSHNDSGLFRQPGLPLRNGMTPIEAYKFNLTSKQSRWFKTRNNRTTKQVVRRILPIQPGVTHSYEMITTNLPTFNTMSVEKSGRTSTILSKIVHRNLIVSKKDSRAIVTTESGDEKESKGIAQTNSRPTSEFNIKLAETIDLDMEHNAEKEATVQNEDELGIPKEYSDDPGIQSLMEISLSSPRSNDDDNYTFENQTPPLSPMGLLRESPVDPKWLEENISDFSYSSFLGHLDTACEQDRRLKTPIRDVDSNTFSSVSDSIDYITKFEELAQSMINSDQQTFDRT